MVGEASEAGLLSTRASSWTTRATTLLPRGDGDADFAVYRPSTGQWFAPGSAVTRWGTEGDIPVPGDYDGDGGSDFAVYRPSTGQWFAQGSPVIRWGTEGDIPVPGDYDGDGDSDFAVYRPSTGQWFAQGSAVTRRGTGGDIPVGIPHAVRTVYFSGA